MDAPGISAPTARHCSIAYTGALWDPLAQMSLMRKRWQDPNLGRFITRDPAGYVDGMSMYLYCRGNPLIYFDPWGLGACADYFDSLLLGVQTVGEAAVRVGENIIDGVAGIGQAAEELGLVVADDLGLVDPQVFARESKFVQPLANALVDKGAAGVAQAAVEATITGVAETTKGILEGDPNALGDGFTAVGSLLFGSKGAGTLLRGGVKAADKVADGATGTGRGMSNAAVRAAAEKGQTLHREFAERVKGKFGWQSERRIPGTRLRPDAIDPKGRPIELKPNTPSGRAKGQKQIEQYRDATGTNGRVIYYDP